MKNTRTQIKICKTIEVTYYEMFTIFIVTALMSKFTILQRKLKDEWSKTTQGIKVVLNNDILTV